MTQTNFSEPDIIKLRKRQRSILHAIQDSYHRMGTNTDENYRAVQREKCNTWLLELTEMYHEFPELLTEEPPI